MNNQGYISKSRCAACSQLTQRCWSWIPQGRAREALVVTVFIQALIILGLSWGEYPGGTWSILGGLVACYVAVDVVVWLIGAKTTMFSSLLVRAGLYVFQLFVCVGYGLALGALLSPGGMRAGS